MAATAKWFGVTIQNLFGASPTGFPIAWVGDECRISLHSGTVPGNTEQDTYDYFNDISASELATAGGYTAGGVAIANKTLTYDSATNTIRLKGDAMSWAGATFTTTFATIRKYNATAANAPLMAFIDFGGTQTIAGGTFTITPDATDGYLRAVAS